MDNFPILNILASKDSRISGDYTLYNISGDKLVSVIKEKLEGLFKFYIDKEDSYKKIPSNEKPLDTVSTLDTILYRLEFIRGIDEYDKESYERLQGIKRNNTNNFYFEFLDTLVSPMLEEYTIDSFGKVTEVESYIDKKVNDIPEYTQVYSVMSMSSSRLIYPVMNMVFDIFRRENKGITKRELMNVIFESYQIELCREYRYHGWEPHILVNSAEKAYLEILGETVNLDDILYNEEQVKDVLRYNELKDINDDNKAIALNHTNFNSTIFMMEEIMVSEIINKSSHKELYNLYNHGYLGDYTFRQPNEGNIQFKAHNAVRHVYKDYIQNYFFAERDKVDYVNFMIDIIDKDIPVTVREIVQNAFLPNRNLSEVWMSFEDYSTDDFIRAGKVLGSIFRMASDASYKTVESHLEKAVINGSENLPLDKYYILDPDKDVDSHRHVIDFKTIHHFDILIDIMSRIHGVRSEYRYGLSRGSFDMVFSYEAIPIPEKPSSSLCNCNRCIKHRKLTVNINLMNIALYALKHVTNDTDDYVGKYSDSLRRISPFFPRRLPPRNYLFDEKNNIDILYRSANFIRELEESEEDVIKRIINNSDEYKTLARSIRVIDLEADIIHYMG